MPELIQTLKSIQKVEEEKRKFQAGLQGINLDEGQTEGPTFDDIALKAAGINATKDDILSLQGNFAAQAGFGIGAGLGYAQE